MSVVLSSRRWRAPITVAVVMALATLLPAASASADDPRAIVAYSAGDASMCVWSGQNCTQGLQSVHYPGPYANVGPRTGLADFSPSSLCTTADKADCSWSFRSQIGPHFDTVGAACESVAGHSGTGSFRASSAPGRPAVTYELFDIVWYTDQAYLYSIGENSLGTQVMTLLVNGQYRRTGTSEARRFELFVTLQHGSGGCNTAGGARNFAIQSAVLSFR
jgi:hypothetical protein